MLECNGYENYASYDQQLEAEKEKFINKDHHVVLPKSGYSIIFIYPFIYLCVILCNLRL